MRGARTQTAEQTNLITNPNPMIEGRRLVILQLRSPPAGTVRTFQATQCSPPILGRGGGGWSPSPSPDLKTSSWSTLPPSTLPKQRQHTCKGAGLACQRALCAWYDPDLTSSLSQMFFLAATSLKTFLEGTLVEVFLLQQAASVHVFERCPPTLSETMRSRLRRVRTWLSPPLGHPQNAKRHL